VAHEDDAERAVRTALRMQESIAEFRTRTDVPVDLRIGVNTGEVLVGLVRAGGDYTAMGDVVNTAERLQSVAEPGTVVVGPGTWAVTRANIEYEPLGALVAKGRGEPVQAWRARQALAPPGYRRRGSAAFVGRRAELRMLTLAVEAAVTRRRAQLAIVVGEAGVGKSRLAEELAAHARREHDALVLDGRCVPYGEANRWWPVAEALRASAGIDRDDPREVADARMRASVAAAMDLPVDDSEVRAVAEGLLHLLGHPGALRDLEPTRAAEEATRSIVTYLTALTATRPVVLVLSDTHWADPLVLETLAVLLERLSDRRFVVLATSRDDLAGRLRSPGRHDAMRINLDPLEGPAAEELLDAMTDRVLAPGLRRDLLDRAGGNPFFLQELVGLLDDVPATALDAPIAGPGLTGLGATLRGDGALPLTLPDTLRGLLAARVDGLAPDERAVLEDAAVWGRTGPEQILAHLGEEFGRPAYRDPLDRLLAKEILERDESGWWTFHNDLIREVVYSTLTKGERVRRHAACAAFIEVAQREEIARRSAAGDRAVASIAHHGGVAAELAIELGEVDGFPPDIVERALHWIDEATAGAARVRSAPALVRLHTLELRLLPPADRRARAVALLGRASAHADLFELDRAKADVDAARDIAAACEDPALVARATLALAELRQRAGDHAEAVQLATRAVDEFAEIEDLQGQVDAARVLGMTHLFRGDYARASVVIDAALADARELGDRTGIAWALQNLAWIAYVQGRAADADRWLAESVDTFRALGDHGGLNWALGLLAFVRFHQGRTAEAEELGDAVLVEARRRGDRWAEGMLRMLAAGIRLWSGRSHEAVVAADEARRVFENMHDRFGRIQATAAYGRALVTSGRVQEGMDVLAEMADRREILEDDPLDEDDRIVAIALAASSVQIGDPERALQAIGGDGFIDRGFEPETLGHADALVAHALALVQLGQPERAVDQLLPLVADGLVTEGLVADGLVAGGLVDAGAGEGDPQLEASPYAMSAYALALATTGRGDDTEDAVSRVFGSPRATYSDRLTAQIARAVVAGGDDEGRAAWEIAVADADAVDDPVAAAVTRAAAATAHARFGWDGAEELEAAAHARLAALGITAEGWRRVVAP
jgi:tetratricopeptide (TPR) repeat protein